MDYIDVLVLLLLLSISYQLGYYRGEKRGKKEGIRRTALQYKKRVLDHGTCPICKHTPKIDSS